MFAVVLLAIVLVILIEALAWGITVIRAGWRRTGTRRRFRDIIRRDFE